MDRKQDGGGRSSRSLERTSVSTQACGLYDGQKKKQASASGSESSCTCYQRSIDGQRAARQAQKRDVWRLLTVRSRSYPPFRILSCFNSKFFMHAIVIHSPQCAAYARSREKLWIVGRLLFAVQLVQKSSRELMLPNFCPDCMIATAYPHFGLADQRRHLRLYSVARNRHAGAGLAMAQRVNGQDEPVF